MLVRSSSSCYASVATAFSGVELQLWVCTVETNETHCFTTSSAAKKEATESANMKI